MFCELMLVIDTHLNIQKRKAMLCITEITCAKFYIKNPACPAALRWPANDRSDPLQFKDLYVALGSHGMFHWLPGELSKTEFGVVPP